MAALLGLFLLLEIHFAKMFPNFTVNSDTTQIGQILLNKIHLQVTFNCLFCNKELESLKKFFKHILEHVCGIDDELWKQLLTSLSEEKIKCITKDILEPDIEDSPEKNAIGISEDSEAELSEIAFVNIEEGNTNHGTEKILLDFSRHNEEQDQLSKDTLSADDEEPSSTEHNNQYKTSYTVLETESYSVEHQVVPENLDDKSKKKFLCHHCGKYLSRANLYNHTHASKTFACEICDAVFNNSSNLRQHRNRHLGIKAHPCHLCDKSYITTSELKVHLRSHTGEKPYKCEECGAGYTTSSRLIVHKRYHTNTRPYACDVCGKPFFSNNDLKKHQQSHSNERPFKCNECTSYFKTQYGLRQHKKIHLPHKQYKCNYCNKEFAQDSGLYGHIKNVHMLTRKKVKNKT